MARPQPGGESKRKEEEMTRNKWAVLGLSALALLAMSVFVASGAQAEKENPEFTCLEKKDEVHTACTVTAKQTELDVAHGGEKGEKHTYTAGFARLECSTAEFHVAKDADGTNDTPTATATYQQCTAFPGPTTAHVNMNGCAYKFHPEKTSGETVAEDEYTGTASIECEPNKTIIVQITNKHNEVGNVKCTIEIHAQSGIHPVYFRNMKSASPTDMTIEADTATVKATFSGGFFNCGVTNGEHHTEYTGNVTAQASHEGETIPLKLD